MIDISAEERRSAFAVWLRTGRRPTLRADGVELKFNPYHDPRNGQFTFAPGGPRSLHKIVISDRDGRRPFRAEKAAAGDESIISSGGAAGTVLPAARERSARPVSNPIGLEPAPAGASRSASSGRSGRGGNQRAFQDPVVLVQVFPGLSSAPAGAIIALADQAFDVWGPQLRATGEVVRNHSDILINDIKRIDPSYRFDSLGSPQTLQGQINQLDHLRMERAAAYLRVRNDVRPLQVETLRFVQERTDFYYGRGLALIRAGKLAPQPTEPMALGNYVDRQVRVALRTWYSRHGIDSTGRGPVRVNRRESNSFEGTFRRPDARVGSIAYDVTLSQKTLATPQVRGFFDADFRPSHTIIIRPSQIGPGSTYVIKRPETRR